MKILQTILRELAVFEAVAAGMKHKGLQVLTGCADSQKTHFLYGLGMDFSRRVVICADELAVSRMQEELSFLGEETAVYPARDFLFYRSDIHANALTKRRMAAVEKILTEDNLTVLTTIDAFFDRLSPAEELLSRVITLQKGDSPDLSALSARLSQNGYERTDEVEGAGQFAVRGGIVDIFGITAELPHRIDFFGDEIESISLFDPETQRSLREPAKAVFFPAAVPERKQQQGVSFLSYFDPDTTAFFLDEPNRLSERADFIVREYEESLANRLEKGYIRREEIEEMYSFGEVAARLSQTHACAFCALDLQKSIWKVSAVHYVETKAAASYRGNFPLLAGDLAAYMEQQYRVLLLCGSRSRAKRLAEGLREKQLPAFYAEEAIALSPGQILVSYGKVYQGYAYPSLRFLLIAESDIFGKRQRKRRRHVYDGEKLRSFSDLKVGDPVVHESHGIGIYRGIEKFEIEDMVKDYLKVEYAHGDNLYIPAQDLNLLQKYTGGGHRPPLSSLGSPQWKKAKTKARAAVKEMAGELLSLYAARQGRNGYAYEKDTVWQREFEEQFIYEETEDQLAAIRDTKRDMESAKIMDRLICGDVGYGKTEVAIRAAFKAVQENKQVAVLTPTTILAQQHYHTFAQRLKDYPVRVDLLCRFRTPKEQKKTLSDLSCGAVDIIIGTHRLLSGDVRFHDLGLLVVDEEQRFGVSHKEKIKKLCERVDVLTLSATPIPRTLHMSLSGIRDMSVIEEAPMDRQPVQTYVMEYNEETVREAANRELARGGQVYFVYNRTETIADMAVFLQKLLPDAVISYIHGKMAARDVEDRMLGFIRGEVDVLVTTTIAENGLDIPNANTMIVYDADQLGLAQLYQLRGRIGRSARTAYAFLLYRKDKILREEAQKRLSAIRQFSDFGSGIKVAMRDLEIRGAGDLLGAAQHGHMEAIGYDLYCKMLNAAVKQLKGTAEEEDFQTAVDLAVDAFIPDTYIPNEAQKLSVYKRIALVTNEEEGSDVADELSDRFGELPETVKMLLKVALLKAAAHAAGLTEVAQKEDALCFTFYERAKIQPEKIPELLQEAQGRMSFRAGKNPVLTYRMAADGTSVMRKTEQLVERIRRLQ